MRHLRCDRFYFVTAFWALELRHYVSLRHGAIPLPVCHKKRQIRRLGDDFFDVLDIGGSPDVNFGHFQHFERFEDFDLGLTETAFVGL